MVLIKPGQRIGFFNAGYLTNRLIDQDGINRGEFNLELNNGDETVFPKYLKVIRSEYRVPVGPEWTLLANCFVERWFARFDLCNYLKNKGIEFKISKLGWVSLRKLDGPAWFVYKGDEILKEKK
jgi:hypothetical protein